MQPPKKSLIVSKKRHSEKYVPHPGADSLRADVANMIRIVNAAGIDRSFKKFLLNSALWYMNRAEGGMFARYRSESVLRADGESIQRDHVWPRKELVNEIITGGDIGSVLDRTVCCIVTKAEHDRLHNLAGNGRGWNRYELAGIVVKDMFENTADD